MKYIDIPLAAPFLYICNVSLMTNHMQAFTLSCMQEYVLDVYKINDAESDYDKKMQENIKSSIQHRLGNNHIILLGNLYFCTIKVMSVQGEMQ